MLKCVPVAADSPWPPLRALHGWAVAEEPAHLDPPPNIASLRCVSIEMPFVSVATTAPKGSVQEADSAMHSVEQSSPASIQPAHQTDSSEALPTTLLLTKLTSIRPQEPGGEDTIYLKFGDSTTETWKLKAGKSVTVYRVLEAGSSVSLWETDDHLYTPSYEPES